MTHVSHNRLMTCLQLRLVPDSALRQALLKASLDKNTNVEYSNVSLNDGDTKEKRRLQREVNREPHSPPPAVLLT